MASPEHNDTYRPAEAERILKRSGRAISERRIRQMLHDGDLEGEKDERGYWRVYQREVHRLLEDHPRTSTDQPQRSSAEAESDPALLDRVLSLERALGRAEARVELTEQAESTVREERDRLLAERDRERQRADDLQRQLEERSRSWWRRWFGGG